MPEHKHEIAPDGEWCSHCKVMLCLQTSGPRSEIACLEPKDHLTKHRNPWFNLEWDAGYTWPTSEAHPL